MLCGGVLGRGLQWERHLEAWGPGWGRIRLRSTAVMQDGPGSAVQVIDFGLTRRDMKEADAQQDCGQVSGSRTNGRLRFSFTRLLDTKVCRVRCLGWGPAMECPVQPGSWWPQLPGQFHPPSKTIVQCPSKY